MTLDYRPTILDVAEAAGVSSRTVSRVIQRPDVVSGATRLGLSAANSSRRG